MSELELIKTWKCFGGKVQRWKHKSAVLGESCDRMTFSTFIPDRNLLESRQKLPVIYWLSGLTCNDENFVNKAGAQRIAAELQIAFVCPDTSPRGCKIEGEEDSWDFGTGAGFYVDATEEKWKNNYNMFSYITKELPSVLSEISEIDPHNCSIMGHSMGGHGALICALKAQGKYKVITFVAD